MREDEISNVFSMFSALYLLLSENSQSLMMVLAEKMLTVEKVSSHVNIEELKNKISDRG